MQGLYYHCGTGALTKKLLLLRPRKLVAVDISPEMLLRTRDAIASVKDTDLVCCDAEFIAIRPGKGFDLLVSASTMQWFKDFQTAVHGLIKDYLAKDGLFLAAFFGNTTLKELSHALSVTFPGEKILLPPALFPDIRRISKTFDSILSDLSIEQKIIEQDYKDLLHLLRVLKMTGVSPRVSKPILSSPGAVRKLERYYAERFGSITATFEIMIVKGKNNCRWPGMY